MKLSKSALLEIVEIVREGLATGTDISEKLRKLDLMPMVSLDGSEPYVDLSANYLRDNPRAGEWKND